MLENKNLINSTKDTNNEIKPNMLGVVSDNMSVTLSYTKTNKLITALYMVTDTLDREEPMRLKLRTLGAEIISDTYHFKTLSGSIFASKIDEVMSFLNIACDIGMISGMNSNILRKEFTELKQSIQERTIQNNFWLEEFMLRPTEDLRKEGIRSSVNSSKGQSTRIGVQKGSTLLKALSNVREMKSLNEIEMSDKNSSNIKHVRNNINNVTSRDTFEILKNKRREEIIVFIKEKNINVDGISAQVGVTITDIRNGAKDILVSCGEKTLQRELVSMVSDNILYRTGSKRWSQYFLR